MATVKAKDVLNATLNSDPMLRSLSPDRSLTIQQILAPVITDPLALNTFITNLYNKFIKSEVITGLYRNPLARLKKSTRPYGDTIERMIFNPATAMQYNISQDTDNILTPAPPDVKVEYIRVTRQDKYAVTLPRNVIMQAFSSEDAFGEFLNGAINSLYNGDTIDEWTLMKKIVSDMTTQGYVNTVSVNGNGTDLAKALINYAKWFRFPSQNYNPYSIKYPDNKLTTWVDPENIVIIARSDVMTDVRIDVLAAAFNLSEVELSSNIIEVDEFEPVTVDEDEKNIKAIICDASFFQVHDTLTELDTFQRADYLSTKSYWHHWQTMTCSLFANAQVITD